MNIKQILDCVYPTGYSCMICGGEIFDEELLICDYCKKVLPYLTGEKCLHCSEPIPSGKYCIRCKGAKFVCDKVVSPFRYDGVIKSMVLGLKYHNKKYYSLALGRYMALCFKSEFLPCDVVTCVPLCEMRFKQRGYNQAELLAREFANSIQKPFADNFLIRTKETPTQTQLNGKQRRENMVDAFKAINKKEIKNKIIVIIDDIYTTGATINECATTLKKAGAKAVYAVTAGHTILKRNSINLEQEEENAE